jgi:hypothetical protein
MSADLPDKICATCGRSFSWRRRLARSWAEVRHCSDACRKRRRVDGAPDPIADAIRARLAGVASGATICPSEVARALFPDDWRPQMERVREAARRLVASDEIEITQGGRPVDPDHARGPIRLRARQGLRPPAAAPQEPASPTPEEPR